MYYILYISLISLYSEQNYIQVGYIHKMDFVVNKKIPLMITSHGRF